MIVALNSTKKSSKEVEREFDSEEKNECGEVEKKSRAGVLNIKYNTSIIYYENIALCNVI